MAFGEPTACGFHICRAVEIVVKQYVEILRGTPPTLNDKAKNWGEYCRILRANGADGRCVDALHQLQVLHRNPLIHPEITLEMGEDLALFVVCQGTIQSCIADMEKKLSDPTPEVVVLLPPPIFDSTGE